MSLRAKRKGKAPKLPNIDFDPVVDVVRTGTCNIIYDRETKLQEQTMAEIQAAEDLAGMRLMDPYDNADKVDFPDYDTRVEFPDYNEPAGPDSFGGSDFVLDMSSVDASKLNRDGFAEAEALMKNLHDKLPPTNASVDFFLKYTKGSGEFDEKEAWIQTYSGKRFTPMKPNPEAIVIQDVAHALSMQCRFSGHVKQFYSVAQHCVLVSHICDHKDALWGLLHDATEAYLVDVPRPLKKSGKFGAYMEAEKVMQEAICERFSLSKEEPESVHRADTVLLATEARDLMSPLRYDWHQPVKPLPFKIDPLGPREAKLLFLERFFELIGAPEAMQTYLMHESFGAL